MKGDKVGGTSNREGHDIIELSSVAVGRKVGA